MYGSNGTPPSFTKPRDPYQSLPNHRRRPSADAVSSQLSSSFQEDARYYSHAPRRQLDFSSSTRPPAALSRQPSSPTLQCATPTKPQVVSERMDAPATPVTPRTPTPQSFPTFASPAGVDSQPQSYLVEALLSERTKADTELKDLRQKARVWKEEKELLSEQLRAAMKEQCENILKQQELQRTIEQLRYHELETKKVKDDNKQQAEYLRQSLDQALQAKAALERQHAELAASYSALTTESVGMRARLLEHDDLHVCSTLMFCGNGR